MTDEAIAMALTEKWQSTGGGMYEALKEALAIGRCQEFERRNVRPILDAVSVSDLVNVVLPAEEKK